MKARIKQLITEAAHRAYQDGHLPVSEFPDVEVEVPRAEMHGDFSTNFAMMSAKLQKMAPRQIAQAIIDQLPENEAFLDQIQIAGPGFINFYLKPAAWEPVLKTIHRQDRAYGANNLGQGRKIQVEFVSSNPTGPLHVGHGRGAAVGDAVANILALCGYDVQREYYINDSGRQIQTLGRSVYLRLKELVGETVVFPDECYQGDYIKDLAAQVRDLKGDNWLGDEAAAIDFCARFAADRIITGIRADLDAFGVTFDHWFSEQSLYDNGKVDQILAALAQRGIVYSQDGAQWFRTSEFGDEKDRVVVRRNGQTTYFASDIAYHQDKYRRGFERVIDVWGADHHGYINRMTAAIRATGYRADQFVVLLVQLVNLLRDGQPVAMSTRAGDFETLANVISEVGRDAARFIFLTRHYDSPLEFDLELAKKKTNDNPVYYVQYVHARIASIIRKASSGAGVGVGNEPQPGLLEAPEELKLIKSLARYPEIVTTSAQLMEPHRITYFLMELAALFHAYYNKHRVLTEDMSLTQARLYLVSAVKKVIRNGLTLLGVSAPERM
jgi:arginyl-tRNA synthetase